MEEQVVMVVGKEPEEQVVTIPNEININTLSSNAIEALLKNVKITEYSKAAELTDIIKNRSILIGDIDEDTGSIVDNFIRFWNVYDNERNTPIEKRTPIKICIDSNGGDFLSTLTIIDAIENSATPVWTVNIGRAYSGGLFIMLAGHRRLAYKRSTFLFHEGSIGGDQGDAIKFQNYADHYKALRGVMKELILEKTKISEEEYSQREKDDWWFMVNKALEKGVIDEIATGTWNCE